MKSEYGSYLVALCAAVLVLTVLAPLAEASEEEETEDPTPHQATTVGGFLGYDLDLNDGEFFAGVDVRINIDLPDVTPGFALTINPALSYYFVSGATYFVQLDGNLLATYAIDDSLAVYGGLGPVVQVNRISGEFGGSTNTETLFNLLVAGLSVNVDGDIDGFGQLRMTRISNVFGSTTLNSVMVGLKVGI